MSTTETVTDIVLNGTTPSGGSLEQNESDLEIIRIIRMTKIILLPVYVLSGLFGNTLSLIVFGYTPMKHFSCSTLLMALAVSDNLFLLSIGFSWADLTFTTDTLNTNIICQLIAYVSFVSSFLSAWFVVSLTIERYIAICHPFQSSRLCTRKREKILILVLSLSSCVLYSYPLWTTTQQKVHGRQVCISDLKYLDLVNVMVWFDTALTVIIPVLLLFLVNLKVMYTICTYRRRQADVKSDVHRRAKTEQHAALDSKTQRKITKTLLLVVVTFFVLTLPSHVFRLWGLIQYITNVPVQGSISQHILHSSFELLNFLTYCTNFFLYAASGKLFRKHLWRFLCKKRNLCYYKDIKRPSLKKTLSRSRNNSTGGTAYTTF